MSENSFYKKISEIQKNLKAPKGQFNAFGKYKYRNCEDILEAVKPLLGDLVLTIGDEIVLIGDRFYVKATATITDGETSISNSAYARESLTKKGQDDSQVTGSTSSYARKYALNGLLCIDDTKDADSDNNAENSQKAPKIDYKQKNDLIVNITKSLNELLKNYTLEEKAFFLKSLNIATPKDLQEKSIENLKDISDKIAVESHRRK